jgi:hypothetical protein
METAMELERTVRAAFALRAPAADFEEVVMKRLAAGAWRASQSASQRRSRLLLVGVVMAVSAAAAAALVAMRYSSSATVESTPAALPLDAARLSTQRVEPVDASPRPVSSHATPPTASTSDEVSQLCKVAAEAPPVPVLFTVLLEPLRIVADDADVQPGLRDFHGAVADYLRTVPGLGLVDGSAAGARPADYRFRITAHKPGDHPGPVKPAGQWFALSLETWKGSEFQASLAAVIPGFTAANCGVAERRCAAAIGAKLVRTLSARLPRLAGDPEHVACEAAKADLLKQQLEEERRIDPAPAVASVLNMLRRLAAEPAPTTRFSNWRAQRASLRPDLIPGLVAALRDPDDAFRKELVTLLAVKFGEDHLVRSAFATVAGRGPESLTRHVAERVISGEAPWRDYALARYCDSRLTTTQRLEPLYWMAEAELLDREKLRAEVNAIVTVLQASGGIRALGEFMGRTQGEAETAPFLSQQGQMTIRMIASLDNPAVPELLIAYFEAAPNYLTLNVLATRGDDPRVASKLQAIAAGHADKELQELATSHLRQPVNAQLAAPSGN